MSEIRCLGCMRLKHNSPVCEHCGYDERRSNDSNQLPAGTILQNQYIVGKVLGQGGFGITYMGWDRLLEIPVAIKEYFPSAVVTRNTSFSAQVFLRNENCADMFVHNRDRFAREARSLAKLGAEGEVPNIVRVHNLIQANSTAYIVMEYVKGTDLRSYISQRGGTLSLEETIHLLLPVMDSLNKLHASNIIHRDLSPDNIMVLPNGTTKLIDFGAAHEVRQDEAGYQHSTEAIVKHGFAPPEQYIRKGSLGSWTDVYAMCATVYYCITGHVLPSAADRKMGQEEIQWDTIAANLQKVLRQGLALDIQDRIQTMAQLHQAFESLVSDKKSIKTPLPKKRKTEPDKNKQTKHKKRWDIGLALAISAIVVGALGLILSQIQPKPQTVYTGSWEDNVLMHTYNGKTVDDYRDFNGQKIFRSDIRNNQILSVTFLDTLDAEPADSWDVSKNRNGTVKAWVVPNDKMYDLYIAANGGINGAVASSELFCGFTELRTVSFGNAFYTDTAEEMDAMFAFCRNLSAVDLSTFNTRNLYNVRCMFYECKSLTDLALDSLYTSRITDMVSMFYGCSSLTTLDISGFDTSNVTDMSWMFSNCYMLTQLDIRTLDTSKVTNMMAMFESCEKLTELDVSGFETSNVTDMSWMFNNCKKLRSLDVTKFNTSKVTNMQSMFSNCNNLKSLDVSKFDTSQVKNMCGMFYSCRGLESLDVSHFDTSKVTDMAYMFYRCEKLTELNMSSFITNNVTTMRYMFYHNSGLTNLDLSGFDTSNVTDMSYMFCLCRCLTNLDISDFDTVKVENMSYMFNNTDALYNVSMPKINTLRVQNGLAANVMDDGDNINGKLWKSYFTSAQYGI